MNKSEIINRLKENETFLRSRGICHVALFGSKARGDDRPDSDTDIMIEIDASASISVYDYVNLKDCIAKLIDGSVDVVNKDSLKPHIRPAVTIDAVYAF